MHQNATPKERHKQQKAAAETAVALLYGQSYVAGPGLVKKIGEAPTNGVSRSPQAQSRKTAVESSRTDQRLLASG